MKTWLLTNNHSQPGARTDAQIDQFRMFVNMFGCFTHRFKVDVRRSDGSTSKIRTVEKHLEVLCSDSMLTGG